MGPCDSTLEKIMKLVTRELNDEELDPVIGGLAQAGVMAVKFQIGGETMVISADANSYSVNTSWGYNTQWIHLNAY
jgi:hypothetical protein